MVDNGVAVGFFDPEKVPESRLLLGQVIEILVIFVDCGNTSPQTDGVVELFVVGDYFFEFGEETGSEFGVEVGADFGCGDGLKLHQNYCISVDINRWI